MNKKIVATALACTLFATAIPAFANDGASQEKNATTSPSGGVHMQSDQEYVSSLTCLNDEEKKQLLSVYEQMDQASANLDALYNEKGELKDPQDAAKADTIEKDLNKLSEQIAPLLDKCLEESSDAPPADMKAYVSSLDYLTDDERARLLPVYEQQAALFKEMDALLAAQSQDQTNESPEMTALWEKYDTLSKPVADIEEKIANHNAAQDEAAIAAYVNKQTSLTDEEKSTLLTSYQQINQLYADLDKLYDDQGQLPSENQQKSDALSAQLDTLYDRIKPLEDKLQ